MSVNYIAKFARILRASLAGCSDEVGSSRCTGWTATRPLAVAVAAAALVTAGETPALAQFVLFGFGQQPTVSQPRVAHVRKHVARQHAQPTSSKQAAKTSDCLAPATSDSESHKTTDGQLQNPSESAASDKTSPVEKKKHADRTSKRHADGHRGRSANSKLASARPDCAKIASVDSESQKIATVEPGDPTESAASRETSSADTKRSAAHRHKRDADGHRSRSASKKGKIKNPDSESQKIATVEPGDPTESAASRETSSAHSKRSAAHRRKRDADGHRSRSASKKGKIKNPDSESQKIANVEQIDSAEPTSAHGTSSGDKKRHAAHGHKHKPKRLASSGKGAVKTSICSGLARFLPGPQQTASLSETNRRIADAWSDAVAASDAINTNDLVEPTCSGVVASFYSEPQKTANGEEFDPTELTAAHRSLPFGTKLRVTNLRNSRSVVVTVNDRGPFVRGRIVDVSTGAATALGFRSAGVAPVRVELVSR